MKYHGPYSPTILKNIVFFSKICKLECNNFWLAKPYGLVNQKLCYIHMLLITEKSGDYDKEYSKECMVGEYGPISLIFQLN